MNNTIMTAKNTFSEGLIMDMAPDNTQANTLTSALNATLITFNGNEMSLQNDMGNGRVETARLPEGYVPLGTCEFGDIIYIVSYNPLTNKSQIGCFPSPERNISSEEVTDTQQSISSSDFQKSVNDIPTGELKTMSVKKVLIGSNKLHPGDKFIIYTENSLNNNSISDLGNTNHAYGEFPRLVKFHVVAINDENKITYLDQDIKWYDNNFFIKDGIQNKQGTNKPDLDSYRTLIDSAYSIFQSKNSGKLALVAELESIKSFNCTYSINTKRNSLNNSCNIYLHTSWDTDNYNINPSGIAILESSWVKSGTYTKYVKELNEYKISDPIKKDLPINNVGYNIFAKYSRTYQPESNVSYENFLSNNYYTAIENWKQYSKITPQLSEGNFVRDRNNMGKYYLDLKYIKKETYYNAKNEPIQPINISDDIVNNYFKKDVIIPLVTSYDIPSFSKVENDEVPNDLSNLVWKVKVAPCMPYGVLEQYAVELIIDFSTVGKNIIEFNEWKYYNSGELSTLTYGFNVNLDNTQKVKEIAIDFYDNQGIAATYINNNKSSYSGSFTERFGLNGTNINYKLGGVDSNDNKIYHAGQLYSLDDGTNYQGDLVEWSGFGTPTPYASKKEENVNNIYINDAGSLYANFLYKALITISYGVVNELGDFVTINKKQYSRWFWTNPMYNTYYYSVKDFNALTTVNLELASQYELKSNENYNIKNIKYYNSDMNKSEGDICTKSLGAMITSINQDGKSNNNLNLKVKVGLKESYNTFYLTSDISKYNNIDVTLKLGQAKIECDEQTVQAESSLMDKPELIKSKIFITDDGKITNVGPKLHKLLNREGTTTNNDIWQVGGNDLCKDSFNVKVENQNPLLEKEMYINPDTGEQAEIVGQVSKVYSTEIKEGFNLTMSGIMFNKQCFGEETKISGQYPVVESIARSESNRDNLNISHNSSNQFFFNKVLQMNLGAKEDGAVQVRYFTDVNASKAPESEVKIGTGSQVNAKTERLISGIYKLGLTSPLVLGVWTNYDDTQRMYYRGKWVKSNINNTFSSQMGKGDQRVYIGVNKTNLAKSALFQLFINDYNRTFYPLNEFTINGKDYTGPYVPINQTDSITSSTIANDVIAVLSNLYYCTSKIEQYDYSKLSNLNHLKDYSETWSKHFIINSSIKSMSNILDLVTFYNGTSLNEYLASFASFPKTSNYAKEFTVIVHPNSYLLNFQYIVNSNNDLQEIYNELGTQEIQSLIYKSDSKVAEVSFRTFKDNLYWENDQNELQELTKDFEYYTLSSKEFDPKNNNLIVTKNKWSKKTINNFGQWFGYDEKTLIKIKNYPYTDMVWIASGKHDNCTSNFNFSSTPVFTGLNKAIQV